MLHVARILLYFATTYFLNFRFLFNFSVRHISGQIKIWPIIHCLVLGVVTFPCCVWSCSEHDSNVSQSRVTLGTRRQWPGPGVTRHTESHRAEAGSIDLTGKSWESVKCCDVLPCPLSGGASVASVAASAPTSAVSAVTTQSSDGHGEKKMSNRGWRRGGER